MIAWIAVLQALLDANSHAPKVADEDGLVPLHYAMMCALPRDSD